MLDTSKLALCFMLAMVVWSQGCGADGSNAVPPGCVPSLSGIGKADFTIRFKVSTRATIASTILYQRASCDARSDLWDVNLTPDGYLRIAVIEAGAQYTDLKTLIKINDGASHDIAIQRANLVLSVSTDGAPSGAAQAPQKLGQLPPLGLSSGDPCEPASVMPLVGTVSEVCLGKP